MHIVDRLANSTSSHARNKENFWSIEKYITGVDNEIERIKTTVFVQILDRENYEGETDSFSWGISRIDH